MHEDELDRRDPTPIVLARLETKLDNVREDVSEIKGAQRTFVTLDRMELEIAARNQAVGGVGAIIAEHIRRAETNERELRQEMQNRIRPLEDSHQQQKGALALIKWLVFALGGLETLQILLQLHVLQVPAGHP